MQDSAKLALVILSEGRSPKSKDLVPQVHLLSKFYFIKWASPKILRLHYVSLRMTYVFRLCISVKHPDKHKFEDLQNHIRG